MTQNKEQPTADEFSASLEKLVKATAEAYPSTLLMSRVVRTAQERKFRRLYRLIKVFWERMLGAKKGKR